jgi:stage IV sporulation protein B
MPGGEVELQRKQRQRAALFLFVFLFSLCTYATAAFWPVEQNLAVGEFLDLSRVFPRFLLEHLVLTTDSLHFAGSNRIRLSQELQTATPGSFHVRVVLLDVLPLRTLVVNVQPVVRVYPGGQALGVLLHAQGVIVVGYAGITERDGDVVNPAASAGLRVGDLIVGVDGHPVTNEEVIRKAVFRAGGERRSVVLKVKRGDRTLRFAVRPAFCRKAECYRIGLLIRDSTAGVGTLTFYDPVSRTYGALGHEVAQGITSRPLALNEGRVVEAFIQGVRPAERGKPGEKIGVLTTQVSRLSGAISHNTPHGIFGCLDRVPKHPFYSAPIPVALAHQVRPGKAELLTVLEGNRLERFEIEICRVNVISRANASRKDLVLRVTDPRLLRVAGGIVQGMSGSPIIQRGRLVGVVTHVFVNDPERGYGIFAERMVRACGLLSFENNIPIFSVSHLISTGTCCKI